MSPKGYPLGDWVINVSLMVVFILAIALNSMILHILHRKQLKSTTFRLIANQTVSEILFCVLILSNNWFCWSYSVNYSAALANLCALLTAIRESTLYVSNFSMIVIAYERYRKLYHPLSGELNNSLLIALTWILGISFSIFRAINRGNFIVYGPKFMFSCKLIFFSESQFFAYGYNFVITFTICNVIPLFVIAFYYYKVIIKVRERKLIGNTASKDKSNKLDKNKRRTTEMLITLVAWFFIVTLPFCLFIFFGFMVNRYDLKKKCSEDVMIPSAGFAASVLFYLGSLLVNPFIIFYYNPDFKQEVYRIFCINQSKKLDAIEMQTASTSGTSASA